MPSAYRFPSSLNRYLVTGGGSPAISMMQNTWFPVAEPSRTRIKRDEKCADRCRTRQPLLRLAAHRLWCIESAGDPPVNRWNSPTGGDVGPACAALARHDPLPYRPVPGGGVLRAVVSAERHASSTRAREHGAGGQGRSLTRGGDAQVHRRWRMPTGACEDSNGEGS